MVSDGDGGAFILLFTGTMAGVQKLDRYGYPLFSEPLTLDIGFGQQVTEGELISDEFGGVIAIVRYEVQVHDSTRVGLFRFDHDGNVIYWNASPVEPIYWNNYLDFTIVPDHAGGVYLAMAIDSDDARFQHLGPQGERLWSEEGIRVDIGEPWNSWHWFAMDSDAEHCYAIVQGTDSHAFKFTFYGDAVWGDNGIVLPLFGWRMKLVPDGYGGMVGAYKAYGDRLNVFRLNVSGQWVWPQGGVALGEMYFELNLVSIPPFTYVCWDSAQGENTRSKLCKLDTSGTLVWPTNINVLSYPMVQVEVKMIDANLDGLLFLGYQGEAGAPYLFYTQKYSYDGERLWNSDIVINSPIFEGSGNHYVSGDGSGGGIFTWIETDAVWSHRCCAAMVNAEGELGIVLGVKDGWQQSMPVANEISIFPNPFNSTTIIGFQLPAAGEVEWGIFDIAGSNVGAQRAAPLPSGQWYPAGHHQMRFNASDLSSGIYIYRISTEKYTACRKMVLIK